MIENRSIQEAFVNGMQPDRGVWELPSTKWTGTKSRKLQSSDDEAFLAPEAVRKSFPTRECTSCKGDMNDSPPSLDLCSKVIPTTERCHKTTRDDDFDVLRRSRSLDSREVFVGGRNTEWHIKYNSLRMQNEETQKKSSLPLEGSEGSTRHRKSIYSTVYESKDRRIPQFTPMKSKIPVLLNTFSPDYKSTHRDYRYVNCRQRAPNVAHRCRVNAAFEKMFHKMCTKKYRGNIIDCTSHRKWMREAQVDIDEDGKCFKKCAKGKMTLNITEYKCAIKRMCDVVGSDYWEVLEKMACYKDAGSISPVSIASSIKSGNSLNRRIS
ncbi:hypothetical protein JTE90_017374 [Oedothorax gibbosus]|uniref:Uncharacterized protein n=1 Tax=Oedothorax gibbosus TaxID=931172 RepID=A0AAV6VPF5_9ARAC|nr:hypothetical protein JTE90_017374 [Oedothorax gibbosus]